VTGHPAGHRVDGEEHGGVFLQQHGQFRGLVLGLRDGQPVTGDDDDLAGVGQLDGGVLGGDPPDAGARADRGRAGGRTAVAGAEAAEHDGPRSGNAWESSYRRAPFRLTASATGLVPPFATRDTSLQCGFLF
jgi:hypothetical protein